MSPATETTWEALPDDCWETIFGRIDQHEPLSLVNSRFLAITNLARTTLTLRSCTLLAPHRYTRFPNLHFIILTRPHPNLDGLVRQLAGSNLPLRSLRLYNQDRFPRDAMGLLGRSSVSKTLRELCCTRFDHLDDDDLLVLADSFSYLHRLELHHWNCQMGEHTITDRGILAISIKLNSLVSLFLRCNQHVTDRSFHYLSSNCPLLSQLKFRVGGQCVVCVESFRSFASLSCLNFHHVNVSESGLLQLSRADLQIQKLTLGNPIPRVINGAALCRFLSSCRLLCHLVLKYAEISKDASALDFVASIPKVNYLHITNVRLITPTILFDLLEGCPNLEDIAFKLNLVEIVRYSSHNLPIHPLLRKLLLAGWGLTDEIVTLVSSICPNLESFSVDHKSLIPGSGCAEQ